MSPPRPIAETPPAPAVLLQQEPDAIAPVLAQEITTVNPKGLQKLMPEQEPDRAERTKAINQLAGRLEEAALSGGAEAFKEITKLLRGRNPKEIAQALHKIPSDAVAAQALVVLGYGDRFNYATTLFYLDLYSDSVSPLLLKDRALALISSIHVPEGSAQDEAEVKVSVLSLLARNYWDNNYQDIHSLAGPHEAEGVVVTAVTESADEKKPWFSIIAERGEQRTGEQDEHPGRATEEYGTFVNTSELFSNDIRRVEFKDSRGNLIVRNYDLSDGQMTNSFEFRVFNARGLLIEEGKEGKNEYGVYKSHSTKHYYDAQGRRRKDEGYQNGKMYIAVEFDEKGELIDGR